MRFAPPPPGSRVQELGDRLIVRFRPSRRRGTAFLVLWLTFWTLFGVGASIDLADEPAAENAFMIVWLFFWAFGVVAGVLALAWRLFGRTTLTVSSQYVEVRQAIGRFARVKRYETALIRSVQVARVPCDDDEPRTDFGLELAYEAETVLVGEEMSEAEAEQVANVVAERIGLRARPTAHVRVAAGESHDGRGVRRRRVAPGALAVLMVVVIGMAAAAALLPRLTPGERSSRAPVLFSKPSEHAAAQTLLWLTTRGIEVSQPPHCPRATWTRWACDVPAEAPAGEFAGLEIVYRCSAPAEKRADGVACAPLEPVVTPPLR